VRGYELAYIADPELDEAALAALEERVKSWVQSAGGTIGSVDRWGKRKLAYPIRKKTEGHYVMIQTELPAQGGMAIEREFKLNEQVLRFLITLRPPAPPSSE
jgi:small subunit ribosomal protein S6